MQASNGRMNFPNRKHFLLSLAVCVSVTCFHGTECSSQQLLLRREVGQNVTFTCTIADPKPRFVYLQRGEEFVNGFHSGKVINNFSRNTRVEHNETHVLVHMYKLNVSHNGNYSCIIMYQENGNGVHSDQSFALIVRANYTKPTVSITKNSQDVLVTCNTSGGYPEARVKWDVPGNSSSHTWKVVNNSEESNQGTKLVNSSSTASFNCSNGEMTHVRCFVGEVTSDRFNVCTKEPPPPPSPDMIIVIIAVLTCMAIAIAIIAFVLRRQCMKRGNDVGRAQEEGSTDPSESFPLKNTETKNI